MKYLNKIKEYVNLSVEKIKDNYILFLIIFLFVAIQGSSALIQSGMEKKKNLCYTNCMPSQYEIIDSECWCYNESPDLLIKLKK